MSPRCPPSLSRTRLHLLRPGAPALLVHSLSRARSSGCFLLARPRSLSVRLSPSRGLLPNLRGRSRVFSSYPCHWSLAIAVHRIIRGPGSNGTSYDPAGPSRSSRVLPACCSARGPPPWSSSLSRDLADYGLIGPPRRRPFVRIRVADKPSARKNSQYGSCPKRSGAPIRRNPRAGNRIHRDSIWCYEFFCHGPVSRVTPTVSRE